jgi:hypothetical protein
VPNLKASSRVCSGQFEEDDIIKDRLLKGKDGKEFFCAWNNWSLKEGAISRIFPGYHFCFINLLKLVPSFLRERNSGTPVLVNLLSI